MSGLWIGVIKYGALERRWIDETGKHYLQNAVPGAFFAVGVFAAGVDLIGAVCPVGPMLGICVVGRPTARMLPQDGTAAEVTRMVLTSGLPYGTASQVLRVAVAECARRGARTVYAYHDRTRHTGCIYRKAGFFKEKKSSGTSGAGWSSRAGRQSAEAGKTPKTRWAYRIGEQAP